jgi:hypothetical protein
MKIQIYKFINLIIIYLIFNSLIIKRLYANPNVSFKDGFAKIEVNGEYGLINNSGKIVIKPQFDYARDFNEGMAIVSIDGKWGILKKPECVK